MGFTRFRAGLVRVTPIVVLAGLVTGCVWPFGSGESGMFDAQTTPPTIVRPLATPLAPPGPGPGPGENKDIASRVNSFLWRASLDTIAFMPLASADPYGGVIITDWLATPENPNERFKLTVYVLDSELRADAVKVAVFRQTLRVSGIWADARVGPESAIRIENTILSRARQLRLRTTVG